MELDGSPGRLPNMKKSFATTETSSMASCYQYAAPANAMTLQPQMQTPCNRAHQIGRKLAFWKKKAPSAAQIHSTFQALTKSHEKYQQDLKTAMSTMRDWTEYLSPPMLLSQDLLQHQMVDVNLSQWITSVLDTLQPVIDSERKVSEVSAAFTHSFEAIKKEEANLKLTLRKQCSAERRYFKAMASEWNAIESQRLDQERIRLVADVECATDQFRATCRRELPVRVIQLNNLFELSEREYGRASQSLVHLIGSEERIFSRSLKDQSFTPSTPSSIFNSPNLGVEPLQTPKFPGLSSSNNRAAPQPSHEATTPIPDEQMDKQSFKADSRVSQVDIAGLGNGGFVWS